MLNVLFFLEPSLEKSRNPLFRYKTLRNSINPQLLSLKLEGHNTRLLTSDIVINQAKENNEIIDIEQTISVDMLEWTNCVERYNIDGRINSPVDYQIRNQLRDLKELILEKLGGFIPDVLISWESNVEYFKDIYPDLKIVYCYPGVFSRPPYPNFITFTTKLLIYNDTKLTNPYTDKSMLNDYRNYLKPILTQVSPVTRAIKNIKSQFKQIILLPLQIDGYFTVDDVISGFARDQFDLITKVLSSLPKDIGLLVTSYKSLDTSSNVLTPENKMFLKKKYKNFVYNDEFESIPNVSQFIVPEVDGVIVISSALAFQATLWEKPLLTIGTSHVSHLKTDNNIPSLLTNLGKRINRDYKIARLIQSCNLLDSEVRDSKTYTKFIENFIETNNFDKEKMDIDISQYLIENSRIEALIKGFSQSNLKSLYQIDDHVKELSNQIRRHEVVSFDIFDTLLCRPFKSPSNLFDFMQNDVDYSLGGKKIPFKELRQQAEKKAFEASLSRGIGETTLEEIYDWFAHLSSISTKDAEKIMQLEMDYELELLRVRSSGYLAYSEALVLNKTIILVSDMYLSKDFIEKLLKKNGITGYEKLYLSSEYKEKKHSGRLFQYVIDDYSHKRVLHIGDNLKSDVVKAKEKGIKAFHLPRAYEKLKENDFYKGIWQRDEKRHSNSWNIILSIIAEKYYGNPYNSYHRRTFFNGNASLLGYSGLGPFLLGYIKWLIEKAIEDDIQDLFFLSRDGKIMKSAYDIISQYYDKAPKSHYLLCSRRAVNVAKIDSLEDIYDLLEVDFRKTRLEVLLEHRFGLKNSMIDSSILERHGVSLATVVSNEDKILLRAVLESLFEIILDNSMKEREKYIRYLKEQEFISDHSKAVVDIGYAGTMQESLSKLTNQSNISGYYLMTFYQAKTRLKSNSLNSSAYLAEFVDRHDTFHPFCRHVPLYETLFSAPETSFVRFTTSYDDLLVPVFMDKQKSEDKRILLVNIIQGSAIEFIEDFSSLFRTKLNRIDIEPNKSLRVLTEYFHKPSYRDALILSGVVFEDAYGSGGAKIILPKEGQINEVDAVWHQGQKSIKDYVNASPVLKSNINSSGSQSDEIKYASNNINNINIIEIIEREVLKNIVGLRKYKKYLRDRKAFFKDSDKALSEVYWKIFGDK